MKILPPALHALAEYKQFILWKPVANTETGKTEKRPINPHTGLVHDPHDPGVRVIAQEAIDAAAKYPGCGIGFVFTANDPLFFIDLDHCLINGQWSQVAQDICAKFAGCAIEVSQSGEGLHIFGVGAAPDHACDKEIGGFYTEKRFVALTGTNTLGAANVQPQPGALEWLVNNYFSPSEMVANPEKWTNSPVAEWTGPVDDQELINKMMASKSVGSIFGGKASIQALWNADANILGTSYPDVGNRPFNHSSADAALTAHLAWWTGKDCERVDRLFRMSALYREKWEKRADYRHNTILKAVGGCETVYNNTPVKPPFSIDTTPPETITVARATLKSGLQYLTPDQQVQFFAGCVYVQVLHRIFTPNGMLLKPEQFKAMYGGYIFALDSSNDKTTKNAWEVFTESQAVTFPKCTNIVFRPDQPPGAMIQEEGLTLFNNYVPIKIDREKGDISPFMGLVTKLFPDNRDREIILSYMAACTQYPGKKFQWAPLIQGCEGNGKSLMLTAVSKAVGIRYTHKPPASDISNIFNAWISGKLFIAVEEVYVDGKREVMDALKTLITDDRVAVTPKGVDQTTGDNRANFMCTSNHKNAIRIAKKNNRRWCVFYTPQQSVDDIENDGMDGVYFPNLWTWFKNRGHAIISEFLATYPINDEFNPATLCHRAPWTTSIDEAATATLGGVEQDIMEAIAEGRPGFSGGWLSSMALAEMLKNRRINMNKRNEILTELGFQSHPGLTNGRVNSIIPLDGGKPRLYILKGHPHALVAEPTEIIRLYIEAQGINILT